ncbi:MAG: hypothetical protein KC620_07140 [Myxococcales bacterium]|nr:hypothetical protein [Myxococcales bacterium]
MRRPSSRSLLFVCLALPLAARAAPAPRALQDMEVVHDDRLVRGAPGAALVTLRAAYDWGDRKPLAETRVTATLQGPKGAMWRLGEARTDAAGHAPLTFRVPAVPPGRYTLHFMASSPLGEDDVARPIEVVDALHLHLRTDRGRYRPGQRLQWRVTALGQVDARPRATTVTLTLRDPRGTQLWRGQPLTDGTGMIAGDYPLGPDAALGKYTLVAEADGASNIVEFVVASYQLPAFTVDVEPLDGPKDGPLKARVIARYPHGEPVSGGVEVQAGVTKLRGQLDADGRFELSVPRPASDAALSVRAEVVDGANRTERGDLVVPAGADSLTIAVVPERDPLLPGVPQTLTVVVTNGRGDLVPAKIELELDQRATRIAEQADGAARFVVVPGTDSLGYRVSAFGEDGHGAGAGGSLAVGEATVGRARVTEPLIESGAPVELAGEWPGAEGLIATVLRRGVPVAAAGVPVGADGRFAVQIPTPAGLFGLATVRVTRVEFDAKADEVRVEPIALPIFLRPAPLGVQLSAQLRHRPGETAPVAVQVTDAEGKPAAGVGLAASVIDERSLRLDPPKPDLAVALRQLDAGSAMVAGAAFSDLLARAPDAGVKMALAAAVQALSADDVRPSVYTDVALRWAAEREHVSEADEALPEALVTWPGAIGRYRHGRWAYSMPLADALRQGGWDEKRRADAWGRPLTWAYAAHFSLTPFAQVAEQVAESRLEALREEVESWSEDAEKALLRGVSLRRLADRHTLATHLRIDPWGSTFRAEAALFEGLHLVNLRSLGPDRQAETADDVVLHDVFGRSPRMLGMSGVGYGGGGGYYSGGRHGRVVPVRMGAAVVGGAPMVRRRFDETVLWVAGVRTDEAGQARLDVPLADSVTGWQVAVEALSPEGAVGAATTRLETHLPLTVDVTLPSGLTVGDRYVLPVIVQNNTEADEALSVDVAISGPLKRLDGQDLTTQVAGGGARALRLPVEAVGPGEAMIRVALRRGPTALDVVERPLTIEARGRRGEAVYASTLRGESLAFRVPEDAAEGTLTARLRVYRGPADQAMDGLESLLREPHGCFEQTSSATYPNLLVLRLLQNDARPAATEARKQASDFLAKGYQRLVGYEVEGGGFEWFGRAPANQVLTAYGLMEFTDMTAVYPVDPAMIERTRAWLVGKQGEDGAWQPDENWLHDWSAAQGAVATTAYVAWALAEAGVEGEALSKARGFLRRNAGEMADKPYLLALWAGAEDAEGRAKPLEALRTFAARDDDGLRFGAAGQTLFYASGKLADAQITALATPTLHRAKAMGDVDQTLRWLWQARSARGGWGSTQGTVLALRAAALAMAKSPAEGTIEVVVDGRRVGALDLGVEGVPTLDLPALAAGGHALKLSTDEGMMTDLRVTWRGAQEPVAEQKGLAVTLAAAKPEIAVGESVAMTLTLRNPGDEVVPMPTVVVPVPPGFRVPAAAQAALKADGRVARVEDVGDALHLYLTQLAAGGVETMTYALEAEAECAVTQRGPQAYAYYAPDTRGAAAPLRLSARARPAAVR